MAHDAQKRFCLSVKNLFPDYFRKARVLDVGSLDINGNNRYLFEECAYVGIDVGIGPNVDVVCPIHEFEYEWAFDTIISTECFEHDMHWKKSLRAVVRLLKPGGFFLFTCASGDRKEHGTRRTDSYSSPLTCAILGWQDYYRNLYERDIREAIDVDAIFARYDFQETHEDLYFWGVKK